MNKNEFIAKLSSPFNEANYQFHEKYFFSRSLWIATGFALGALAVKGYDMWETHRDRSLEKEIDQFFTDTDNTPNQNAA